MSIHPIEPKVEPRRKKKRIDRGSAEKLQVPVARLSQQVRVRPEPPPEPPALTFRATILHFVIRGRTRHGFKRELEDFGRQWLHALPKESFITMDVVARSNVTVGDMLIPYLLEVKISSLDYDFASYVPAFESTVRQRFQCGEIVRTHVGPKRLRLV